MSNRRTPRIGLGSSNQGSNVSSEGSTGNKSLTSKNFRCIMQRIVERDPPEASLYEAVADPKQRKIQKMAIWTANRDTEHNDYTTTNKVEYPTEMSRKGLLTPQPEYVEDEPEDHERNAVRRQTLESFRRLVRTEYGHTAKLFKAGRKSKSDLITSDDFSYIMSRLKLDAQFTKAHQELIFESFPKKDGAVAIIDIISKIDEIDMKDEKLVASKKEMADIRMFLNQKLNEKRTKDQELRDLTGDDTTVNSISQNSVKSVKSVSSPVPNSESSVGSKNMRKDTTIEDTMKKAIGQRTFDIEVGAEELNDLIEDIYHKRSTKESTEGFARYLRFTNLKLHEIPFYDLRKDDLQGRRTRALDYEEQCTDPVFVARYNARRKEKLAAAEELRLLEVKKIELKKKENLERWGGESFEHPLGPKRGVKGGDDEGSLRSMSILTGRDELSTGRNDYNRRHDLKNIDADYDEMSNTFHSLSPRRETRETIFYDSNQSERSDFYPTFVKSTKSRAADPSMNLLIEPIFTIPKTLTSGKRMGPIERTDFTRVGYGSNCTLYDTKPMRPGGSLISPSGVSYNLSDISVLSVNSAPNSPMRGIGNNGNNGNNGNGNTRNSSTTSLSPMNRTLESMKTSISVDYIGCDDKQKLESTRRARYNRTYANMEGIKRRLEEAELDKKVKEIFNMKSRNEDNIRYDTNVFANDVKCYRSQPLQIMSRKPFMTRSDRMWGGNEDSVQAGINRDDDRTFSCTYKDNYDSQILRDSIKGLRSSHGLI